MAKSKQKVVIVIPTYNEKGNIGRLLTYLYEHVFVKIVDAYEMHVLVVDDTSPDKTADEVKKIQQKRKSVHLLLNRRKAGLGNAYIKGMNYAMDRLKADIIFEFDADFSHNPDKIPELLAKLDEGYDMVLGSRYIAGGGIPENWGWHRKFFSVFGNLVIRVVITNFSVRDWTTGFRAIRTPVVRRVLPLLQNEAFMGYTFQIGFLHKASRMGYKIAEVPFKFVDRTLGKSKLGAEYIINTLYYILGVRAKELLGWRIFRFAVVGVIGAVVQLSSLQLIRRFLPFQLAFFCAVELAVLSNFIWSNVWTFSDRKLAWPQIPLKFVQFNLTSAGSILIQQTLAFVGEMFVGLFDLLVIWGMTIDTGLMYAVIGILLGMFWNFFAYSKIIWRSK